MHQSFSFFSLQNGVVHRDLKLENVLLDENCNIKVTLPLVMVWDVLAAKALSQIIFA